MMDQPRRGSVDDAEADDAMEIMGRVRLPRRDPDGAAPRTDYRTPALRPARFTEGGRLRALRAAIAAPHPGLWLATLALIVVDAVWLAVAGIKLDPAAPLALAALVAVLLAAAACLGPLKSEPSLRAMALASASLIAFTVPVAILHYCAATLGLPLIDDALARAERALGFDWPAYRALLEAHPDLNWWLSLAYHTSGPQIAAVVIVLAATRRLGRLWAFVRLFCATLLCVVAVSAVLPAVGAYAHYAPAAIPSSAIETVGAVWHLDALERLRAGTFDTLVLGEVRGLVTFPSFHVCLAILTAWALAPVRFVGTLALVLNAAVVVATLGSGGHYLPDLMAGAAVAFASLCLHRGLHRGHRRMPVRPAAEPIRPSPVVSGT
ncbi:phosphatase PAP2 family protein [Methylobacterium gregans]|uniref:Inositolphosphotransferase Aur1/Ipt1 domain-containing protein n=1 Tax=Methylobacterium gregans TaxID=374424 RepID=A0AA37MH93_9HYPH|nr:phosphatase PAP2 family protein [Methylobacterium gregans]MDQ0524028.1 hypothetical protein [Methylobacterium gregans]GJD81783.1 hypothetical protein NBEOAGPD_5037 [Methylobacterium gregans]